MLESCICGRSGELADREPVLDSGARWLLRCPSCGHLDDLAWLAEETALLIWGEAVDRRGAASEAA
jgi:hypothetical protein